MWKKILIVLVVLIFAGIACLPLIANKMVEYAYKNPSEANSQDILRKAIELKIMMHMYASARPNLEKSIIWFPESKNIDYYIYKAGVCGEKEKKPDVAIHWFEKFIEIYPEHNWTTQAKNRVAKLKALNE